MGDKTGRLRLHRAIVDPEFPNVPHIQRMNTAVGVRHVEGNGSVFGLPLVRDDKKRATAEGLLRHEFLNTADSFFCILHLIGPVHLNSAKFPLP